MKLKFLFAFLLSFVATFTFAQKQTTAKPQEFKTVDTVYTVTTLTQPQPEFYLGWYIVDNYFIVNVRKDKTGNTWFDLYDDAGGIQRHKVQWIDTGEYEVYADLKAKNFLLSMDFEDDQVHIRTPYNKCPLFAYRFQPAGIYVHTFKPDTETNEIKLRFPYFSKLDSGGGVEVDTPFGIRSFSKKELVYKD